MCPHFTFPFYDIGEDRLSVGHFLDASPNYILGGWAKRGANSPTDQLMAFPWLHEEGWGAPLVLSLIARFFCYGQERQLPSSAIPQAEYSACKRRGV